MSRAWQHKQGVEWPVTLPIMVLPEVCRRPHQCHWHGQHQNSCQTPAAACVCQQQILILPHRCCGVSWVGSAAQERTRNSSLHMPSIKTFWMTQSPVHVGSCCCCCCCCGSGILQGTVHVCGVYLYAVGHGVGGCLALETKETEFTADRYFLHPTKRERSAKKGQHPTAISSNSL